MTTTKETMMRRAILILALVGACNTTNIDAARESAREFIKNLPNATGVECATYDNDHDGYVTCTVFRGADEPLPIQCGAERFCVNCARGCRYVPFKVDRTR